MAEPNRALDGNRSRRWAALPAGLEGGHAAPHTPAPAARPPPAPTARAGPPPASAARLRLAVARLPRPTTVPTPRWWWWSGPTPADLAPGWPADTARFALEPPVRCCKHPRHWTTPHRRRRPLRPIPARAGFSAPLASGATPRPRRRRRRPR